MDSIAKSLIFFGVILIASGLIWHFTDGKIPLGKLPGDIRIEGQNSKIYIPITTGLLLSALFSLLAYLFKK